MPVNKRARIYLFALELELHLDEPRENLYVERIVVHDQNLATLASLFCIFGE